MDMQRLKELSMELTKLYQKQRSAIEEYLQEHPSLFLIPEDDFEDEDSEELNDKIDVAEYVWADIDQWHGVYNVKVIGFKYIQKACYKSYEVYYIPENDSCLYSANLNEVSASSYGDLIELLITFAEKEKDGKEI